MCILKYFDMDSVIRRDVAASSSGTSSSTLDLSKEEFFRGITIFAWVMVILLALILIFSFDKISSRSSPWTLTVSDYDYLPLPQSQTVTDDISDCRFMHVLCVDRPIRSVVG